METNPNYTIVGAFVLLLLTAIILAIIWLSSGFTFERYKLYRIYMQESISGLNVDSAVEYNGVNVGNVKKIEINKANPRLVELLINIKSSTPITQGTVATLQGRGLTGVTYVALKDDGKDLRPILAVKGQPYPVIPTAPSLFLRIETALSEMARNFDKMSVSLQALLDKENLESIKKTLTSLKEFSQNLAANNQRFNSIMINTEKVSRQFIPLLKSSKSTIKMLKTQTLPITYQMMSNLDEASQTLNQVANELKENPSILIRGVDRQPSGPGETR